MYQTKAAYATARIREALTTGHYAPGERLQASRVAKDLDLSLTPVREAMLNLATEGLIVVAPHRGATVAEFSQERLTEIFDIRAHLESYAAAKAALVLSVDRLDHIRHTQERLRSEVSVGRRKNLRALNDDFHFSIYEGAASELLLRLIRQAWAAAPRDLFSVEPKRGRGAVAEHERILAALELRDADAAAEAMRAHVESSLRLQLGVRAADRRTEPMPNCKADG